MQGKRLLIKNMPTAVLWQQYTKWSPGTPFVTNLIFHRFVIHAFFRHDWCAVRCNFLYLLIQSMISFTLSCATLESGQKCNGIFWLIYKIHKTMHFIKSNQETYSQHNTHNICIFCKLFVVHSFNCYANKMIVKEYLCVLFVIFVPCSNLSLHCLNFQWEHEIIDKRYLWRYLYDMLLCPNVNYNNY